jgi:hypothetical protein
MNEFVDPFWQELLEKNKAVNFEQLWERNDPWFEKPNSGRSKNGWSGVCRIELDGRFFFLKKQENFLTYSLKAPLGQSLVVKEKNNLVSFNNLNVPCMKLVYFGVRKFEGRVQGMIMTEALNGYISLDEAIVGYGRLPLEKRRKVIHSLAKLVKFTHEKGVMHNSLYPKHLFIEENFARGDEPKQEPLSRFIDLETAKKAKNGSKKQLRDLDTLNRRTLFGSKTDRLAFVLTYLGQRSCNEKVRIFLKRLSAVSK